MCACPIAWFCECGGARGVVEHSFHMAWAVFGSARCCNKSPVCRFTREQEGRDSDRKIRPQDIFLLAAVFREGHQPPVPVIKRLSVHLRIFLPLHVLSCANQKAAQTMATELSQCVKWGAVPCLEHMGASVM